MVSSPQRVELDRPTHRLSNVFSSLAERIWDSEIMFKPPGTLGCYQSSMRNYSVVNGAGSLELATTWELNMRMRIPLDCTQCTNDIAFLLKGLKFSIDLHHITSIRVYYAQFCNYTARDDCIS